jgi:hypothetical protein
MIRTVTVVYVTGEIRMAGIEAATDGEAVFKLMRRRYMRHDKTEILTILCGDRQREPINEGMRVPEGMGTRGEWRM